MHILSRDLNEWKALSRAGEGRKPSRPPRKKVFTTDTSACVGVPEEMGHGQDRVRLDRQEARRKREILASCVMFWIISKFLEVFLSAKRSHRHDQISFSERSLGPNVGNGFQ